jgi:hypothetical protein
LAVEGKARDNDMGLDDRDYMKAGADRRDDKEVWYHPNQNRRGPKNAEFWNSVRRGGTGPGWRWWVAAILLAIAFGLPWYTRTSDMTLAQAVASLRTMAVGLVETRRGDWSSSTRSELPESQGRIEDGCEPTELLRTMATRWVVPTDATRGRYFLFENRTAVPVLVRVVAAEGAQPLLETVLVMPGEQKLEAAISAGQRLELVRGSEWCNREVGWKDAQLTKVDGVLQAQDGIQKVAVSELGAGKPLTIAVMRVQDGGQAPTAGRVRVLREGPPQQTTRVPPPVARRAEGSGPREADSQMQSALDLSTVRIKDWRDVPRRDLWVRKNGDRTYILGTVGGEQTMFQMSLSGYSAIGEEMAQRAGAAGCVQGRWLVLGQYWTTCLRLIPSVSFGSVELENVLMAILPGERTPVIGSDLLGKAEIFAGHDGYYVRVGR